MKRSPLVQGLILLLLAVLIGAALIRRTHGLPKFDPPRTVRTPDPAAPLPSIPRDAAPSRSGPPETPIPGLPHPPTVPTFEIRGKLIDVNGDSIPYSKVEVFALDRRKQLTRLSVETDDKGAFQADCPEWSHCTFTAHLPGHGRACLPVFVADRDHLSGTVNDFTLPLRSPVRFDGVLTTSEGIPAANARLRFHPISTKYLDPAQGAVALNLLNGTFPADDAWDEQCRKGMYLTDCELLADAQGEFHAHSLRSATTYAIEVEREGQERAVIELHTRGLKDKVRLQIGR